jgi:hypothetical protein
MEGVFWKHSNEAATKGKKKRSTTLICSIITVRISSIISYFAER